MNSIANKVAPAPVVGDGESPAAAADPVVAADSGRPASCNYPQDELISEDERGMNGKRGYMDTQLYVAAAEGKLDDLSLISDQQLENELTPAGNTVLHVAAQFGKHECCELIVRFPRKSSGSGSGSGSSLLRRQNQNGDTPLHLAAREGHLKAVKILIKAAAKQLLEGEKESMLRMSNQEGDTALHEAVRYHHPEVVKKLIREDTELTHYANKNYQSTPLYMAAERGFGDLVHIILDMVPTAAHHGPLGRTALHAAVVSNSSEMVKRILEKKEELIKEVDKDGWSPLHCGAYLGYKKIVKQLLEKIKEVSSTAADEMVIYLRVKDDRNRTALHMAASRGHKGVAKLLASRYPDCCEQVDSDGNNAIHLFMMQRRHFLKILCLPSFRSRALLNAKNNAGQTPLHLLAHLQMDHGTDFIMSEKVDKMALNNLYFTATDIISSARNFLGRRDSILRKLKSVKAGHGPSNRLKVDQTINEHKAANGSSKDKASDEIESRGAGGGGDTIETMKKKGENHLIVVTLIAAITFTAGFTLPGGYDGDDGAAILTRKTAFKIFVVADTTALVLSMAAVCVYFFMALNNRTGVLHEFLNWGFNLTMFAMGAMMIAFVTGLYTVLPDSTWLVAFIFSTCSLFFIFLSYILRKFYSSWKVMIKSSFWFRKFKVFVLRRKFFLTEWGRSVLDRHFT